MKESIYHATNENRDMVEWKSGIDPDKSPLGTLIVRRTNNANTAGPVLSRVI
jgi:hypothetical protein